MTYDKVINVVLKDIFILGEIWLQGNGYHMLLEMFPETYQGRAKMTVFNQMLKAYHV
jgi:hypothetical protein